MAEDIKKEAVRKVDRQKFIARKLKVINEMPNKAKARYLANRILSHK